MKFSEQWLREWVNPACDTDALSHCLSMAGLEVDSVEPAASAFSKVIIGHVISVEPHPDADRLRVCRVEVGEADALQIVCGAPNVAAKQKVPVAMVGGAIGEMKIKRAKLRGVESQGMICSERELGLSDSHEGIMVLPADAEIGQDFREYLSLNDHIFDIDITPNRGDCLSIQGVGREVAALLKTPLTPPKMETIPAKHKKTFPVQLIADAACPRYVGRQISGINAKVTSPLWLQEKLRRSGLRSIHPVVDVTNYVMLELGQPMHAFDQAELADHIEVRFAKAGEKLTLLDGKPVELDEKTLVIADAKKVLAIAGVMGGEQSGVSEMAETIFLESAYFTPETVAGCARRYGLHTDSSFRFERGVDPNLQVLAIERATQLLLDIVGGTPGPVSDVTTAKFTGAKAKIVSFDPARVERLLGIALTDDKLAELLGHLGFVVYTQGDRWEVTVPSYRFDIAIEEDLVEEMARLHGYDNIAETLPAADLASTVDTAALTSKRRAMQTLVERGYDEAISYSFVPGAIQSVLFPEKKPLTLVNPIASDMADMRLSLWPGLLQSAQYNQNRQQKQGCLFEQGLCFEPQANGLVQVPYIAGVVWASGNREHWQGSIATDFYTVKADVEAILLGAGLSANFVVEEHTALHPGQCARIFVDDAACGWIGALHPQIQQQLDLEGSVYVFELVQSVLQPTAKQFDSLSKFPMIRRDLSLLVDNEVDYHSLVQCAREGAGKDLVDITIFDVYHGKGVPDGQQSIALALFMQGKTDNLTDDQIQKVVDKVVKQLQKTFTLTLRDGQ